MALYTVSPDFQYETGPRSTYDPQLFDLEDGSVLYRQIDRSDTLIRTDGSTVTCQPFEGIVLTELGVPVRVPLAMSHRARIQQWPTLLDLYEPGEDPAKWCRRSGLTASNVNSGSFTVTHSFVTTFYPDNYRQAHVFTTGYTLTVIDEYQSGVVSDIGGLFSPDAPKDQGALTVIFHSGMLGLLQPYILRPEFIRECLVRCEG